jgi:DNA-binding transcriptional ArsR family regulator
MIRTVLDDIQHALTGLTEIQARLQAAHDTLAGLAPEIDGWATDAGHWAVVRALVPAAPVAAAPGAGPRTATQHRVYAALQAAAGTATPALTVQDLRTATGLSIRTTRKALAALTAAGLVRRLEGPRLRWQVLPAPVPGPAPARPA